LNIEDCRLKIGGILSFDFPVPYIHSIAKLVKMKSEELAAIFALSRKQART